MPFSDTKKDLEWRKKNVRNVVISFQRLSESDLIDWIEKQPSMQGAIKDLIRLQIERENALHGESNPT